VQQAASNPKKARLVRQAKRFLKNQVYNVAQFCGLDAYGTEPTARGWAFQRQIEDERWHTIQKMRRNVAQLLNALNR
jgi:hypothetical protein